MLQVKTTAFILDKEPGYNDEGKILLFSRRFGMLRVTASGIYKAASRLGAWSEPPSWVTAEILVPPGRPVKNGRLLTLSLKKQFPAIRSSYSNVSWYFFYVALLRNMLPAGIALLPAYHLLSEVLGHAQSWSQARGQTANFIYFCLKLLKLEGVYPGFGACLSCESLIDPEENGYYQLGEQGLLCDHCKCQVSPEFSPWETDYAWGFIQSLPLEKPFTVPEGILRIKPEEREILVLAEQCPDFRSFFANLNSCRKINDLALLKVRNFLLIFLTPLL